MSSTNPHDEIASAVGPCLDLWQPRDWPHRRGDNITLDLLSFPLTESSGGRRPVACENCGQDCACIHDNVMCWKCKGCFCFHCTGDGIAASVMAMDMSDIVARGWGTTCHACHEPFRSIALIDVFRCMMEDIAEGRSDPGPGFTNKCSSLVKEAEQALSQGRDAMDRGDNDVAISAFTHAINAINYLTSVSLGMRLVLRAKDILLIAHHERAALEGNGELCNALLKAFPNASGKRSKGDGWHLSENAFESLFYTLPAHVMIGSPGGGVLRLDMRSKTKAFAFESDEWKKQLRIANMGADELSILDIWKKTTPNCDGVDALFDSLGGKWKGVLMNQTRPQTFLSRMNLEDQSITLGALIQFIRAFKDSNAAREYTRIIFQEKKIGEEGPPTNAVEDPSLAKALKKHVKARDVEDFHKVRVLKSEQGPFLLITAVLSIGNVSTKIFVQTNKESKDSALHLIAKAVSYLDSQLQELRTSPSSTLEVPNHQPDLTVCAYCGKVDQSLKTCTKCKLARFCGVPCQKKHWEMAGPFAHKPFCKSVARHLRNPPQPRTGPTSLIVDCTGDSPISFAR